MSLTREKLPVWKLGVSGIGQLGKHFWVLPFWILTNAFVLLLAFSALILAAQEHALGTSNSLLTQIVEATFVALSVAGILSNLAILSCAAARMVVVPNSVKTAFLKFGEDERRMALAYVPINVLFILMMSPLWLAFYFVLPRPPWVEIDTNFIAYSVLTVTAVSLLSGVLLSRLMLSAPIAVQEKRFGLFRSWAMTRGIRTRSFLILLLSFILAIFIAGFLAIIVHLLATSLSSPSITDDRGHMGPDLIGAALEGKRTIDGRELLQILWTHPASLYSAFLNSVFASASAAIIVVPFARVYEYARARDRALPPLQ